MVGSVVAIVAVVAIVIALLPNQTPPNPVAKGNEGPAQLAARTTTHVSRADRASISATLDQFIPAAVDHQNGRLAWSLSGPALKGGSTLTQWEHNNTPIPAYPGFGGDSNYDGWRVLDATSSVVDFSVIVHHRKGTNIGDWIYQGTMIKVNGRWLVNGFYTAAINNPVRGSTHEVGPADFAASSSPGATPPTAKPKLGRSWLVAVLSALVGVFIVMALIGVVVYVRGRRARNRVAEIDSSMPPLPGRPRL